MLVPSVTVSPPDFLHLYSDMELLAALLRAGFPNVLLRSNCLKHVNPLFAVIAFPEQMCFHVMWVVLQHACLRIHCFA